MNNKIDDGLDELRELRKKTINRWRKAGLLEGLSEDGNLVEKLFEPKQKTIINENETKVDD